MKKTAILYIALGRYVVFWEEFFESCEEMLLSCEKRYFIFTDCPPEQLPYGGAQNVTVIPVSKRGWPYDTLMRFEMFCGMREEILKCDYAFFFNANMKFYNPTDLSEIAPREWHGGLSAGAHPAVLSKDPALAPGAHWYEPRQESTARVPPGSGRHYVCGAFNGGTSVAFMNMCAELAENVQKDLNNGVIAHVHDESHLNAYLAGRDFLFVGIAYGFPEKKLNALRRSGCDKLIKIVSRSKGHPKYGGLRYLRGQTDKKLTNNFTFHIMRALCRVATWFAPSREWRRKLRRYYG